MVLSRLGHKSNGISPSSRIPDRRDFLMSRMASNHGSLNPPIIMFQHCDPSTRILCFNRILPVCPLCRKRLRDAAEPLLISPVRLPSVLVNARNKPFSLVIKPTHGTFLQSYMPGHFLHAGLTNSKGIVYSYDEDGIHDNHSSWEQSVVIPLLDCHDYEMKEEWDTFLHHFSSSQEWTSERYQDEEHNCFDFVVGFLNHIHYNEAVKGCPRPITKEELCQDYIVTMTTLVANHIAMHREIVQNGYMAQR